MNGATAGSEADSQTDLRNTTRWLYSVFHPPEHGAPVADSNDELSLQSLTEPFHDFALQ